MPPNQQKGGSLDARETADLIKEFHKELVELTRDVTSAISTLDKIRTDYDKSWASQFKYLLPAFIPVFIIVALLLAGLYIPSFRVSLGSIKIEKVSNCIGDNSKPQHPGETP